MMDNSIPSFSGFRNFRDFGGYATAAGQQMRKGHLFRSAHFAQASSADLQLLEALKIQTIVDLRRPAERERNPSPPHGIRTVSHPGEAEGVLPPHMAAFERAGSDVEAAREAMMGVYRALPFDPMIVDLYRDYFAALEEGEGPVLIHCSAGKDRTGLACALTHHLAGVSREDMMEDYLATNRSNLIDEPTIAGIRENLAHEGRPATDDAIRMVLSVRPEFLEAALASIAERYASLDAYFDDVLGLTARRRAAILRELLGDTEPS
jgi:protein tyrosine/serine phosphatase